MKKLYILAALILTISSCDALIKTSVVGTYKYLGDIPKNVLLVSRTLEFTKTKVVLDIGMTMDYTVEDGYAYINMGGGSQARFKIVSADTLYSDSMGCEGTYVRVQQ